MWDDLLEIALEFVSALVGDVTQDTSIPRGIRCTIQAICGIVLAGIIFLLGYLFDESAVAMTIGSIIAGIVLVITTILVIRNWRRGEH